MWIKLKINLKIVTNINYDLDITVNELSLLFKKNFNRVFYI